MRPITWVVIALLCPFTSACEVSDPGASAVLTEAQWPQPGSYELATFEYDPVSHLSLDLYRPRTPKANYPVIVYIHGGGWFGGNRSVLADPTNSQGKSLLAQVTRGYAVASVDYRLSLSASFPQPVLDIKRAIRWIQTQPDFGQSPVAVAGTSAGGNLAVLVAVTAGVQTFEPDPSRPTVVRGAVNLDGPIDLRKLEQEPWRDQTWFAHFDAGTPEHRRFGETLQTGEMVPAYLGCTNAQLPLTASCRLLIDESIGPASPSSWTDPTDPPLYLACNVTSTLIPDCAHDQQPFAADYIARHDDSSTAAWIDQLDQPDAHHGNVDRFLNFTGLSLFLDLATG